MRGRPVINPADLMLLGATLVLTLVAAGEGVLPGDVTISRWIQGIDLPGVETAEWLGYWLGSMPGIFTAGVVVMLMLILIGRVVEAVLIAGVMLSRGLNPLLKWVIQSPRPTTTDVRVSEIASNYGFPSGHVMGVILIYGSMCFLAYSLIERVWMRWVIYSLSVLATGITSFGRIHNGAHWPSDVLGGYLWGICLLLLFLKIYQVQRS